MACPIPEDQQPLNEYIALKESFFYRWATLELWAYLRIILCIWLSFWLVTAPVAAVSFPPARHLWQFLCLGSAGSTVGLCLPLLLLFSGWVHVKNRLQSQKIFYEETGWYDGQQWEKPEPELLKDRLLVTYEVQPVLNKIQKTILILIGFFAVNLGILQIL
ncbi:CGLD27 family protein [Tumidithrix elongata RA019]|uniref:CGLD27 family protein n=1 Tax=Tumidithrix elongata BACA0141 TaxID=2716417 RepID=A0AAW9PS33_9CYAN|nr:CGLD27 family protein [Tumidithrix elongata RA019]